MPEVADDPGSALPDRLDVDEGGRAGTAGRVRLYSVQDGEPPSRIVLGAAEDWRGLLLPLARAQDALTHLEAAMALASEAVRDGLLARVALAEAAGWLAHQGVWVSETDLALRDAGLVGAWGVASHAGRLAQEMPATVATAAVGGTTGHGAAAPDGASPPPPDDRLVGFALRLARHWRELALPEWVLAAGGEGDRERDGLRRALATLGRGGPVGDDEWRGWLMLMDGDESLPPLVHAARLARVWQEERAAGEGRADLLSPAALFLAAALWRGRRHDGLSLPLWSAPPAMLHALALRRTGTGAAGWTAGLLATAAEAARHAHGELRRLQEVERRGVALAAAATSRSRLPTALDVALRLPVLTPGALAVRAGVSARAGLALVGRLVKGGVLREVTGRGAWRAYALAAEG